MKAFLIAAALLFVGIGHAEASKFVCEDGDYHMTIDTTAGGAWINFAICEFSECYAANEMANFSTQMGLTYDYGVSNGIYAGETMRVQYANFFTPNTIERIHDRFPIQTFSNCRQI